MSPEYVAPARWPLTVLHLRNPSVPAMADGPQRDATEGVTQCGEVMKASDLWQLVEREPGDRVCPGCRGEDRSEEQGSLL